MRVFLHRLVPAPGPGEIAVLLDDYDVEVLTSALNQPGDPHALRMRDQLLKATAPPPKGLV